MEKWIKIEVIPYQKMMKKRLGWPNSIQNVLLRLVLLIIIQYYQASPHDSLTQTCWTGQDFRPGCLTWPVQPVQLVRHSQTYSSSISHFFLPRKMPMQWRYSTGWHGSISYLVFRPRLFVAIHVRSSIHLGWPGQQAQGKPIEQYPWHFCGRKERGTEDG